MSEHNQYEMRFGGDRDGITYVVHLLILANILVFAGQLLLDIPFGDGRMIDIPGGDRIIEWVMFNPAKMLGGLVWTPLTYMFLHGGLMHLFGNMLMLYFFGPEIERVLGSRQFLRFYLLCGGVGVLANFIPYFLIQGGGNVIVAGASGATLGVLVAYAMVEPDRRVFLFPIPIPVTTRLLVMFIIALSLVTAVSGGSGVSVATHFGGMAVGYFYMKWRPIFLQAQWHKRGRKIQKSEEADEEKMAEAVDNIFDFKNKNR
ncbi:MAG: rhomboid family intramembrane serine protease [Candidatus Hydrogenedentota bacterium]